MARITGIGGVFMKARDPKALSAWYAKYLGLALEDWGGAIIRWPEDTAEDKGVTVWNLAASDSSWFPGPQMINYRVDDLDGILAQAKEGGATDIKGPDEAENGRFAWVVDPEGNKVELWEPKIWREKKA